MLSLFALPSSLTRGTSTFSPLARCPGDGSCPVECRNMLESFASTCFDQLVTDSAALQRISQLQTVCLPGGGGH